MDDDDSDEYEILYEVTNTFRTSIDTFFIEFNSPQKWRPLFDHFDNEGFGEISIEDFIIALTSPEFQTQVSTDKIEQLYHYALYAQEQYGLKAVQFHDFLDVVST